MEETKPEKTILVLTNQLDFWKSDKPNFYGNICDPVKIEIPYGTIVSFLDFDEKFIVGDKEYKNQCAEYVNLKTKTPIKKIQINILDPVRIMFFEKGNEINMFNEMSKIGTKYDLKNGNLVLPIGTPLFNKKLYFVLTESVQVQVKYEIEKINQEPKQSGSNSDNINLWGL